MKVMKFGGTSLANAACMGAVANYVAGAVKETRVCLVASAVAGVTDLLLEAARRAESGEDVSEMVLKFRNTHESIWSELAAEVSGAAPPLELEELGAESKRLLTGIRLLREASKMVLAQLCSLGERASSAILRELLTTRGLAVHVLDPRKLILVNGNPLEATPCFPEIRARFSPYRTGEHRLLLLPGFFGGDGETKTLCLGRGGSDYSAALAAAALDADVLEIWTDVDGIFSADPRLVPDAFPVPELSFEEAMELAYFGAKVLHPRTIQPVRERGIPVRVRNSFRPDHPGSLIKAGAAPPPHAVRGLTLLRNVTLLNLTGSGMPGVPGVAAQAFGALAKAGISVILITQGSSEFAISLCVAGKDATLAVEALERAFEAEVRLGRIDAVERVDDLAIMSIVGDGMRSRKGVAATFFQAMAHVGVNIIAIAQGSSERNISAVIAGADAERGSRHTHHCFFESREVLELYLFGLGGVGSAFAEQVAHQRPELLKKGLELRLVGVANSKVLLLNTEGFDPTTVADSLLSSPREDEASLQRLMDFVRQRRPVHPVFVDCTSDQSLAEAYGTLLESGFHVVAANKKANSASFAYYRTLRDIAHHHQRRFLYETNVGAGLPVIDTLQNLVRSGDHVLRVEAILSGSMSFVLGLLEEGVSLSDAVREAKEKGFTEPDPRDDLSGRDVARKMLILAREMGRELEYDDVAIEGLLLPSFNADGTVDTFLTRLTELDEYFRRRIADLHCERKFLRFMGTIEDGKVRVGLREVGEDHPFRHVKGGENALTFLTERYQPQPIVVRGYGAGAQVTAAGVLADVLRLATRSFL